MFKWGLEDFIVKTSSEQASDQMQALVSGRFNRSELSQPIIQTIGVLPEHWQILWSSRVAGLPDIWSVRQDS